MTRTKRNGVRRAALAAALGIAVVGAGVGPGAPAGATGIRPVTSLHSDNATWLERQSLDGSNNNRTHPDWGVVGADYSRVAPAAYLDGLNVPLPGPNARYLSNRVFNDRLQDVFSERSVSQWGSTWGQFLDHTFGRREGRSVTETGGEPALVPFDPTDPLEQFPNALPFVPFLRSTHNPTTGITTPREQINVVSSYIDAWAVYGGTADRLEWLREGPVDGDLSNNSARLLMPGNYLPRGESRGDNASAPLMDIASALPKGRQVVAGDIRANENLALLGTQTMMAREHNRIVSLLPANLTEEAKFQIARRVVAAEQQYITYNEFLPAVGVRLPAYTGYNPTINTELSNEFATTGYRAHSMIHSAIGVETQASRYTPEQLAGFVTDGFRVTQTGNTVVVDIPVQLAFEKPDLVERLQLGPLLQGLSLEPENNNDEQISQRVRTAQFRIPVEGRPECVLGPVAPPGCPTGVNDIGLADVERNRDHGVPNYNALRAAYGLPPKATFAAITGEASQTFPADPLLTPGNEINDPNILDYTHLYDIDGHELTVGTPEAATKATSSVRRVPLAAKLAALYGTVDNLNPFVGMVSEPHVPGTEFGELQLASWTREFQRLRDGDRFFYGNDPGLTRLRLQYGIDFRHTLAELISFNTDIPLSQLNPEQFVVRGHAGDTACHVTYTPLVQVGNTFAAKLTVKNTGTTSTQSWKVNWRYLTAQKATNALGASISQNGATVTVTAPHSGQSATLSPGETATVLLTANWDGTTNARPTHFTLNNGRCTVG